MDPSETPLIVHNSTDEAKTFLLIPTDGQADNNVTAYSGFKGTLTGTTLAVPTEGKTNYALNGSQFVWVSCLHTDVERS